MKHIFYALFLALLLSVEVHAQTATLSWTNKEKVQSVDGYFIERKLNALTFEPLTTVNGAANTSFVDTTVNRPITPGAPSNLYTYRVLAFNSAGSSPFSNEASIEFASPPIVPPAPPGPITIVIRDAAGNILPCTVDAIGMIRCGP